MESVVLKFFFSQFITAIWGFRAFSTMFENSNIISKISKYTFFIVILKTTYKFLGFNVILQLNSFLQCSKIRKTNEYHENHNI